MTRLAIQLYTVRKLDEPLPAVIRRVADAGYEGVEFATRLADADADEVASALEETGVEPVAAHLHLDALEADLSTHLNRLSTVGCNRVVIPHLPPATFRTPQTVDAVCESLNDLGATLADHGFELHYHNGNNEFRPLVNGRIGRFLSLDAVPAAAGNYVTNRLADRQTVDPQSVTSESGYGRIIARTRRPALSFEVDAGWVTAAGYDPEAVFEAVRGRMSLVHMHDVEPTNGGYHSAMPGEGLLDLRRTAEAAEANGAEWLVYEHDDPADPVDAIRRGAEALAPLTQSNPVDSQLHR